MTDGATSPKSAAIETEAAAIARGHLLYLAHCSMCHQMSGLGTEGVYPPLAGSDWLAARRDHAIRAVVAGLKDEIMVNGVTYRGQMPPIVLNDAQVADTLTFVLNSWGNAGGRFTEDEVKTVRATTAFNTFEALKTASDYNPLPKPPEGFAVTELARLPDFATRLTSNGQDGRLYILGSAGAVWRFDPSSGSIKQIVWPKDFVGLKPVPFQTLGLILDAQGRLWITVNQRVDATPLELNEVAVYRTSAVDADGDPVAPRAWFRTSYPYGMGGYNHGISDIRFGPDGLLYVSSGSRTDSNEPGTSPKLGKMGEVDLTACVWRFDPRAAEPKLEIIARGIRNAYSLGWDGTGNMFAVSNGPNEHAPEEMDFIVPPKKGTLPRHHGFPYQFGAAPADRKWYSHTPPAPPEIEFVLPVVNLGPAGTLGGQPTSTFAPHSSPAGMVWLDAQWPESVRNSFLVGRFGNFLPGVNDEDTGFDVLCMKLERRDDGGWAARTTTFIAPLGRPIDVHLAGSGKIYILEYTRQTSLKGGRGFLPGRILELAAAR